MSAIEKYKAAKQLAARIENDVWCALGRDRTDNDKHRASIYCRGLRDGNFSAMVFDVDCSYGYHGSSSGYSATSTELAAYLATAIEARLPELLDEAVRLAKVDAEKLKQAARTEAQQVLEATS